MEKRHLLVSIMFTSLLATLLVGGCAFLLPSFVQKRTVDVIRDLKSVSAKEKEVGGSEVTIAELGQFGDMHGFVNSFFSGATLILVISGMAIQLYQLSHDRKSAQQEMRVSGMLATIPILISDLRSELHSVAPTAFPDVEGPNMSVDELEDFIATIQSKKFPEALAANDYAGDEKVTIDGKSWTCDQLEDITSKQVKVVVILSQLHHLKKDLYDLYWGGESLRASVGIHSKQGG